MMGGAATQATERTSQLHTTHTTLARARNSCRNSW